MYASSSGKPKRPPLCWSTDITNAVASPTTASVIAIAGAYGLILASRGGCATNARYTAVRSADARLGLLRPAPRVRRRRFGHRWRAGDRVPDDGSADGRGGQGSLPV